MERERVITISRASGTLSFPTNFILVGAMNP
ncbi:MAG: ATP-binding protein [Chloroflexota bacterium]|nr:ATP-binding protein [Chloroflexota bacterium]